MGELIHLTLKAEPALPVEAESITPDNLRGKNEEEIKNLPVWCGNVQEKIGDYFEVEKEQSAGEIRVVLTGECAQFKRIGQGMSFGELVIEGGAGFHTGALMRGGSLQIKGDVADWLGAQMEGGRITVAGNAGHFVGAAYRGKTQGMSGGMILIEGDAGQMTGSRMRRGLIAVKGNCGDALGFKLLAGTIFAGGRVGRHPGANMLRGTIILGEQPELLPSFYYNCTYRPVFWNMLCAELAGCGFFLSPGGQDASFKRYSGDALNGGKGEILVWQST
ncbi:hypothetical protein AT727_05925 [Desulfitobacterium hafniense]|uniref:Uncharacterized protein n=1 Tax=Desulfitobacterium hafniense TaxID=49338 RepID=A0A0W1JIH4_DESHA|nr:formylmethanofuran dehydrogenase subunit C [Desulfitobacterium hafniense]KTE91134.1 hypothetical protein AT727_05925 [Desulfitobacterium hafniense]